MKFLEQTGRNFTSFSHGQTTPMRKMHQTEENRELLERNIQEKDST
jgi:hypothetical protein